MTVGHHVMRRCSRSPASSSHLHACAAGVRVADHCATRLCALRGASSASHACVHDQQRAVFVPHPPLTRVSVVVAGDADGGPD